MPDLIVTGYAEVDGLIVTGQATAEVRDRPHCITDVIEVEVNARRLIAFAEIIERHAGALRRDLESFMDREYRDDGFGWFRRDDEGGRM